MCLKNLGDTVRLQSQERQEWIRDKRRETTRDCGERKQRSPSGQLIGLVVPKEKRVSPDDSL